ncbi:RNA degradosome polyphosphate kinase [Amycolatopsis sp. NPDC051371]|uniref:RNA degradosome polyphosphate kinase n=1 Tax=Amycolatopsis sp. NPDC051371 TaxID=3155800 RepID=UPI00341CA5F1
MGAVSTDDGGTPAPRRRRNPASESSEPAKKTTARTPAAKPAAGKKVPSKSTARDTAARANAGKPRPRKTTAAAATPRRRASERPGEEFRAGPSAPPAVTAAPTATETLPDDRYFNRELSWQDFNARVLALAEDESQPLLERTKFLAIFASNLDEFYMVRVAGLKRRDETGLLVRSADGLTPREQLDYIAKRNQDLVERQTGAFEKHLRPQLAEHDILIVGWADLSGADQLRLSSYFSEQIFPVLTPLAVDPAHPFPYISGLSLNLAVTVRDPEGGTERFARVKVPSNVPRLMRVEPERTSRTATFLPLEELIAAHLGELFTGMDVTEHHVFRVTRNADFEVDEDRDEDLLQALERELAQRRFGPPVRLEVAQDMSEHMLELLLRELDVDPADVVEVPGLLDLTCLHQLSGVDHKELKDRPFVPATHPAFGERETPKSVFATLREGDVLVHHPYDSFSTSVQRFIEQAAADSKVLAIKQTLYRTSGDSPIVDALIDAAEAGKQVVALVEIKARFDEQANITWARTLERAGVHVVYGLVGLKTHCKVSMIVRQEGSTIRRYCHIGTGNYNPKTARLYEDIGLFTADPSIGADVTDLFNVLTGYSRQDTYRTILTSPHGIRRGIVRAIGEEIELARAGQHAGIRIKCNSLVDEQIIDALYHASQAGVPVEIVVRGICTLKPGVEGLSENIHVRSILGRFLEHSRVFHFRAGGTHWIGSADMMHRNLDRRIEALVRVKDPKLTAQLDNIFDSALDPATRCWVLTASGEWSPFPADGSRVRDHQLELAKLHGAAG